MNTHPGRPWLLLGTLLFCGSLYGMALTGQRGLGIVTPFGGVAFLLEWRVLAVAAWNGRKRETI